jgi:hypothetical protein
MVFKPGQSGNPAGKPAYETGDFDILTEARKHARQAMQVLLTTARNKKASGATRVLAANSILDRAYGKPAQHIDQTGDTVMTLIADRPLTQDEWIKLYTKPVKPTKPTGAAAHKHLPAPTGTAKGVN